MAKPPTYDAPTITDDTPTASNLLCDVSLLQALVDDSSEVITVLDIDGNYLYVSPSVQDSLGWTPAELLGRRALDIVHSEDAQRVGDAIAALIAPPHPPQSLRFRFTQHDGMARLMQSTARLLQRPGEPPLIVAHSRDITDQENTGQALRDSEERYRQLIENSPDAIIVHQKRIIVFANSAAAELFGAESPQDLIGRPASVIIHPDDLAGMRERVQTSIKDGNDAPLREERMVRLNGEEIWVEAKGVLTDINGQPSIQVVIRDVSQRRNAMQAESRRAKATRKLYEIASQAQTDIQHQLQQALAVAVALSGMESGVISECDATSCTVTHYHGPASISTPAQRQPLGNTYCDIPMAAGALVAIADLTNSSYAGHAAVTGSPQKSYIGIPLHLHGQAVGVLGFNSTTARAHDFDDVERDLVRLMARWVEFTLERKSAAKALEDANRDLSRSNEELQQFAYIASHDLKEPLRAVTTYLQLLEHRYGAQLNDEAKEFMGFAISGARRMQNLIQDLLEFSRVGTYSDAASVVEMERVLAQTLDSMQENIRATQAQVTHDPLPTLTAHEGLLLQLLQNLIGNALKYRHPDTPPRVHVSAQALNGFWRINVVDNGIGVAPEHRERIFQMFRRLHNHEEYEGTGIGLAIAKRIVDRHGGEIGVDAVPGSGSCFFFTLPKAVESGPEIG